jgi:hypothetical protein
VLTHYLLSIATVYVGYGRKLFEMGRRFVSSRDPSRYLLWPNEDFVTITAGDRRRGNSPWVHSRCGERLTQIPRLYARIRARIIRYGPVTTPWGEK